MPRIEVMNIKFNLDRNETDAEVYAALCDIPRGKRSGVVKELLHAALCAGEKASLQIHEQKTSLPKRSSKPESKIVAGSPLTRAGLPTLIRKTHTEQTEDRNVSTPAAAAVKAEQDKADSKDLEEFKSLIY